VLRVEIVLNHTSNEHDWARKAAAGDAEYTQYYWIYPDRSVPNEFEKTTRALEPGDLLFRCSAHIKPVLTGRNAESHPRPFIQLQDGRWIWSTFHHYQWDLN
jgi:amylosucrase